MKECFYLYRYMGKEEFNKILNKELLLNEKNHSLFGKTESKGFCFLNKDIKLYDLNNKQCIFKPEEYIKFLYGIVAREGVLMEFKIANNYIKNKFIISKAIYADPLYFMIGYKSNFYRSIKIKEFSIEEIDLNNIKPIRYKKYNEDEVYKDWHYVS